MKAVVILFAFLFFLYFANPVLAVSVTISDYPSTITQDSFTITASISGATTGTNYLRIDLLKEGTTNYFGETFNNADWYGGSDYSQYLPVSMISGITWSGTVQGRIGSPTSAEYDGSGAYKMRLRRYTSGGGSTAAEANNSAVTVSISLPTPTATPTPTPANTPTPTSVPTSTPTSSPTNTPTPTKTPTPTPIHTPTPTSKPTTTSTQKNVLPTFVLGESTENDLIISPTEDSLTKSKNASNDLQKVLMSIGIVFIVICGILVFRAIKKEKLVQNEEE